jgi:DASH complex subunit Duo1
MAHYGKPSEMERQHSPDHLDIDEDLWTSPSKSKPPPPQKNPQLHSRKMSHDEQNAQDEALRRELHSVRKVNEAIEGAIESLAKARNSMKVSPQCSRVDPLLL